MDKGPDVIVEVLSSENPKGTKGQNETEPVSIDQAKKIDHVHHFMDIRKIGKKFKQNIIPKIFDHETYQTRMLSVVDYEKGRLNIAVLDPKEQKKVTKVSIDLDAIHPLDKMDLHRQTGEMLNRDIMISALGI